MRAASLKDETLYAVDRILNMKWERGARMYLVRWQGYGEKDDTWEPMDNLVGCAAQIRDYEKARDREDAAQKQAVLQVKEKADAEAAARKRQAAEAALDGGGAAEGGTEGGADGGTEGDTEGGADGVLKKHKRKRGGVWQAFDLTETTGLVRTLQYSTIAQ